MVIPLTYDPETSNLPQPSKIFNRTLIRFDIDTRQQIKVDTNSTYKTTGTAETTQTTTLLPPLPEQPWCVLSYRQQGHPSVGINLSKFRAIS